MQSVFPRYFMRNPLRNFWQKKLSGHVRSRSYGVIHKVRFGDRAVICDVSCTLGLVFIANHWNHVRIFTCHASGCDLGAFWWPVPMYHHFTRSLKVTGFLTSFLQKGDAYLRARGVVLFRLPRRIEWYVFFYLCWPNLTFRLGDLRSNFEIDFLVSKHQRILKCFYAL